MPKPSTQLNTQTNPWCGFVTSTESTDARASVMLLARDTWPPNTVSFQWLHPSHRKKTASPCVLCWQPGNPPRTGSSNDHPSCRLLVRTVPALIAIGMCLTVSFFFCCACAPSQIHRSTCRLCLPWSNSECCTSKSISAAPIPAKGLGDMVALRMRQQSWGGGEGGRGG